jgi:hypothetical protein
VNAKSPRTELADPCGAGAVPGASRASSRKLRPSSGRFSFGTRCGDRRRGGDDELRLEPQLLTDCQLDPMPVGRKALELPFDRVTARRQFRKREVAAAISDGAPRLVGVFLHHAHLDARQTGARLIEDDAAHGRAWRLRQRRGGQEHAYREETQRTTQWQCRHISDIRRSEGSARYRRSYFGPETVNSLMSQSDAGWMRR